jgi:hypothetical protein
MGNFVTLKGRVVNPKADILIGKKKTLLCTQLYKDQKKRYDEAGFTILDKKEYEAHGIKPATAEEVKAAGYKLEKVAGSSKPPAPTPKPPSEDKS